MDFNALVPEITAEMLYNDRPPDGKIVSDALDDVYEDCEAADWSPYKLAAPLCTVWAVTQAQEKVNNGSLQYFFENDWEGNPPYEFFSEAFDRIGATETANLLRATAGAFPFPNPHIDYKARRAFLDASDSGCCGKGFINISGKRIMDLTDTNYRCLSDYVMRNLDCFPTVRQKLPVQSDEPAGE